MRWISPANSETELPVEIFTLEKDEANEPPYLEGGIIMYYIIT